MSDEKRNLGASSSDDTSALFVTQRKKQIAEQEAQRKAAEEEAKRVAAEAEVRRLEAEVAARKQKAEEEARRIAQEAEERRRKAEEDARLEEERIARETEERRRAAEAAAKAEAEAAAAAAKAKVEAAAAAAAAPAPEKENPLKKAASAVKGNMPGKPEAGTPKKVPPMPPKGGPKPPMPKAPKPPKPVKPAAPGDGTAAAKKPPMGLFIGIGAAVLALVVIVLVFVLGGKSEFTYGDGYQGWSAPLSISIDDYIMLDDKDRDAIVEGMNLVLSEEVGAAPFDRETVDFTLVDYTSTDKGSAFLMAASEIAGMDASSLVYGETEHFSDSGDILELSVNDFTGMYFAGKLGMITMAQDMIVDAGWTAGAIDPIQLTADTFAYADKLDDDFDYNAVGGFVYCVAETLGLDGTDVYTDLDASYAENNIPVEPDEPVEPDKSDGIGYDVYDDETGLCFDVFAVMPDAQVGASLFDDVSEIGYILRDESTLMSVFNMTDEYSQYNNSDDELVKAMTEIVIENFVGRQFGTVTNYEYLGATGDSGANNTVLADAGYTVDTDDYGRVTVYGQLRNVDHSGLMVLNVIMVRADDGPALEAFGAMTETQHIYEG